MNSSSYCSSIYFLWKALRFNTGSHHLQKFAGDYARLGWVAGSLYIPRLVKVVAFAVHLLCEFSSYHFQVVDLQSSQCHHHSLHWALLLHIFVRQLLTQVESCIEVIGATPHLVTNWLLAACQPEILGQILDWKSYSPWYCFLCLKSAFHCRVESWVDHLRYGPSFDEEVYCDCWGWLMRSLFTFLTHLLKFWSVVSEQILQTSEVFHALSSCSSSLRTAYCSFAWIDCACLALAALILAISPRF